MLLSKAKGHKIVSTTSAETVGQITEVVIDPSTAHVVALRLKKTHGDGDLLPWADLTAFGDDAVTVGDEALIVVPAGPMLALADKSRAAMGKRVLTTAGDELGEVHDIDFDQADGALLALVLKDKTRVDGLLLRAVGSYAVIVATGADDATVVPVPEPEKVPLEGTVVES